jgi:hypothetical protein
MSADATHQARFRFETEVLCWRGPAPFFFAPMPAQEAAELRKIARFVSYGWGCVPVDATVGDVAFYTALFPKDETYLLPLKAAVRRKTGVTAGDLVAVEMTIRPLER